MPPLPWRTVVNSPGGESASMMSSPVPGTISPYSAIGRPPVPLLRLPAANATAYSRSAPLSPTSTLQSTATLLLSSPPRRNNPHCPRQPAAGGRAEETATHLIYPPRKTSPIHSPRAERPIFSTNSPPEPYHVPSAHYAPPEISRKPSRTQSPVAAAAPFYPSYDVVVGQRVATEVTSHLPSRGLYASTLRSDYSHISLVVFAHALPSCIPASRL